MICFDCQHDPVGPFPLGLTAPPVGICTHCGAAVCAKHAVVEAETLYATAVVNRRVAVEPDARRIRCRQCSAAEQARQRISAPAATKVPV